MEEYAPGPSGQISVNAEFYRKLTQQIVQKDNIIKLLRLQVENLRVEGSGDADVKELRRRLDEAESEVARLSRRLEGEQRRNRQKPDEEQIRIEYEDELIGKERLVRELREQLAGLYAEKEQLSSRLDELEQSVGQKPVAGSESDEAWGARAGGGGSEDAYDCALAEARSAFEKEIDGLRAENVRLHQRLVELRDKSAKDGALIEELRKGLDDAVRKLDSWPDVDELENRARDAVTRADQAESRLARLEEEKARLSTELDRVRKSAENDIDPKDLRLLTGLVQLCDQLGRNLEERDESRIKDELDNLAQALGMSRIETVGSLFNEKLHQEIETVYSSEYRNGLVIEEKSPGFEAFGAVLKLADVVVSRDPLWCDACLRSASPGSRFCNICGGQLLAAKIEGETVGQPATAEVCVRLGLACENAGDADRAYEHYCRAIDLADDNRDALLGRARIEEHRGLWEAALADYERLAKLGSLSAAQERGLRRLRLKIEILGKLKDLY